MSQACCPECKATEGVAFMATANGPEAMFCTQCKWSRPELKPEEPIQVPCPLCQKPIDNPRFRVCEECRGEKPDDNKPEPAPTSKDAPTANQGAAKGKVKLPDGDTIEAGAEAFYNKLAGIFGVDPENPVIKEQAKNTAAEARNVFDFAKRLWDAIPEKEDD